jgi:TetR/AcrR family transcriptional regulator, transcriptional repressor for nem operon
MNRTKEQILICAQKLTRQRGYNGFSYADIASEIGIRKASLHHHFATKNDLGIALIEEYTSAINNEFHRILSLSLPANEKLSEYFKLFNHSISTDCMCLGGMLASEARTLDKSLLSKVNQFFTLSIDRLSEILMQGKSEGTFNFVCSAKDKAQFILATLQGALLIAHTTKNANTFVTTVEILMQDLTRKG